jgi:hypothetical protein
MLKYLEFITEAKFKNGEPIPKHLLMKWVSSGFFNNFPVEATREILDWEFVFKSPISNSFYSKKKGWNLTHDGTIRISDHWNFFAQGRFHCKTKQEGIKDAWAKGIYDKETDKWDLVEFYKLITKEDSDELVKQKSDELKKLKNDNAIDYKQMFLDSGGQRMIDFGKEFVDNIKKSDVIYKDVNIEAPLLKWKMAGDNPWLTVLIDGEKLKLEDPKDFTLTYNGITYTRKEIFSKLGIYRS